MFLLDWLEAHWKRHEPEPHHYQYDETAVPEYHTGKVKHEPEHPSEENIHYDNVAIPEVHFKKK